MNLSSSVPVARDPAEQRRRIRRSSLGRGMLGAASTMFGVLVRARARAYDSGMFTAHKVGVPVISVGNLLAGGSGKTPVAESIARECSRRGHRVVLLSRGYGGTAEKSRRPFRVDPSASTVRETHRCGDEPVMLAQRLRGRAEVVVCPDRVTGARWAERILGAEVIVLDDGFQHRALGRDLDLVIFPDAEAGERGELDLLPLGLLREPLASVQRADLVLVCGAGTPILPMDPVRFSLVPSDLLDPSGRKVGSIDELRRRRVALLTAVARPERFESDVLATGATVVERCFRPDHADFPVAILQRFLDRAQEAGAQEVVVTAKDAVKIDPSQWALPLRILDREVQWEAGAHALEAALDALLSAAPRKNQS